MKKISKTVLLKAIGTADAATEYTITGEAANAVYDQLLAHKDIEWTAEGVDYIVPFHAVMVVFIIRSSSTVEAPTDANCKEE